MGAGVQKSTILQPLSAPCHPCMQAYVAYTTVPEQKELATAPVASRPPHRRTHTHNHRQFWTRM